MVVVNDNALCRPPGSNSVKWFKFDDGEVTEAKIDDEEVCAYCGYSCFN